MLADKETARFGEYFVMLGEGRASRPCLHSASKGVDLRPSPKMTLLLPQRRQLPP